MYQNLILVYKHLQNKRSGMSLLQLFIDSVNLQLPQEKRIVPPTSLSSLQLESPPTDSQRNNNLDHILSQAASQIRYKTQKNVSLSPRDQSMRNEDFIAYLPCNQILRDQTSVPLRANIFDSPKKGVPRSQPLEFKESSKQEQLSMSKRSRNQMVEQLQNSKQYNTVKKKLKITSQPNTDEDYKSSVYSKKKVQRVKRSKYFDPKPYVMRKIKYYIKHKCPEMAEKDHRLSEEYFRKNINEEFYRKVLFAVFSSLIDKNQMFEEIRSEWLNVGETSGLQNQNFSVEERKLILDEIRRVQLLYTYDTKTIQKTMWNILHQLSGEIFQIKSFKKENYSQISQNLNKLISSSSTPENYQNFWNKVEVELKEKNPLKFDSFALNKIKNQYFDEEFTMSY